MNSLWVILIDASGSMGEPFSSEYEFKGFSERSQYHTKLEEAKDRLLKEIKGFPDGDVAVIAFASRPHLVCRGPVTESKNFEAPISKLTAGGGTNIAAAILFGLNELENIDTYKYVSFLIISDGLSNEGDPEAAAQQCEGKRIPISTVLIDPTPEGDQIARAISKGGRVYAVTSPAAFKDILAKESREQAKAARKTVESPVLTFITVIAGIIGLTVTITGIFVGIVETPTIAIPSVVAALAAIGGCVLLYIFFAKEQTEVGFYRNPNTQEQYFPKKPKYSRRTRILSLTGGILSIVFAFILISFAYFRSNSVSNVVVPTSTPTPINTSPISPIPTPTETAVPTATP